MIIRFRGINFETVVKSSKTVKFIVLKIFLLYGIVWQQAILTLRISVIFLH